MTLRNLLAPFIFFLLLLSSSCDYNDYPPVPCHSSTTNYDSVFIDPLSFEYFPYTSKERLIFKNENGEELEFLPTRNFLTKGFISTQWILTCEEGIHNYYTYSFQAQLCSFVCEDKELKIRMNLHPNMSTKQELFIDRFYVTLQAGLEDLQKQDDIQVEIISSEKGNANIDPDGTAMFRTGDFEGDMKLNKKLFYDVYSNERSSKNLLTAIYYNKEYGVIAFKDRIEQLWVFEEFRY